MFKGIALFLASAAESVRRWLGMKERAEYREHGRTEQKAENLGKAVATKDAQLEIAAKPRRSRAELLKRAQGRKREP